MNVIEFGKRLEAVGEDVLGLTQVQFSPLVNTTQSLLSRLERGKGGSIHLLFDIVSYLNKNNYNGHMLLRKDFNINLFSKEKINKKFETINAQIIELKEMM